MPDTARGAMVSRSLRSRMNRSMPTSPRALLPVISGPFMHNSGTGLWYLLLTTLVSRQSSAPSTAAAPLTSFQLNRLLPAETRSYVPAVWASFAQFSDGGRTTHLASLLRNRPNTWVYAETTTSMGQTSLLTGPRAVVSAGEATVHSQRR